MIPGEPRKRPGRPPVVDLRGQKFGHLLALERTELGWRCQCDCGEIAMMSTADLKWNGRKSCGCGLGRQRSRETAIVGGGLVMSSTVRSLLPEQVALLLRAKYRRRMDDECPLCGHVPARRLTMLYGMKSPLYTKASMDPRNYMVLCELCFDRFRQVYGGIPDKMGTMATWTPLILGDDEVPRERPLNKALLRPHMELFRSVEPRSEDMSYGLSDLRAFKLASLVLDEETNHG